MRSLVAKSGGIVGVMMLVIVLGGTTASAEPMDAGKAFTKLTRGFINLVTGFLSLYANGPARKTCETCVSRRSSVPTGYG